MPVGTRFAALAAIGCIDKAALGLAARSRFTTRTRQATGTTGHLHLDLFCRVITRHRQFDQGPRRAWLTITAVAAVGTPSGLAPGTTRRLTVGPVESDKSWRPRTTARVDQQLRCVQGLDLQIQIASGASGLQISARRAASGDLAALGQRCTADFQFQRLLTGHDRDSRVTAQVQFANSHFGHVGRNQQRAVIGDFQTFQLQGAGSVGQTHQRVGFYAHYLSAGQWADEGGEQTEFTHGKP
ncbi:hypothetical protein D3C71_650120 [compost metagenome]